MSNVSFDFSKTPGKVLNVEKFEKDYEPIISVIMPFYNDGKTIEQSVNSVLNQTFPCFELLILNDGSTDEESLENLKKVEKLDKRIKVIHKENEGVAATRDLGVSKSSDKSKYIIFLDSDDLLEPTYFECCYWTLETNTKASWAYTDSVGFDGAEYTWNKWFDSEKMKRENELTIISCIRKEDFNEVNGFEIREKNVFEDWNLWLKLIAKEKFPVRMNFYGAWYRRKADGELNRAKNSNNKRAMEIISNTAKTIKKTVEAIQYPKADFNWEVIEDSVENVVNIKRADNGKINLLMIIPWMVMGGADKFNLDLIKRLDKNKYDVTIVSTEPAINTYYQEFREYAHVYDLTTFIDQKYWLAFINYIIEKNNINVIMNTNSEIGYTMLPYLKAKHNEIPIIDYIHMEEWYNRNGGYSRDSSAVESAIDKTLTCNKNSEKILAEHFGRNPKELNTVYIGVNEDEFNPRDYYRDEQRKVFGVDKEYVIGFICRITEQKRPFLLLEVIKELKKKRNDFVFLVAGTGNLLSDVKAKVKELGISENIKFIGEIKETQNFYIACDLTFNCSIKEGLALTAYESLAMGVPVISSDVGGQKELINEDVGVIVPCLQKEEDIWDFNYSEDEIYQYVEGVNNIIENLETYKNNCRDRILSGFTISQMVKNMSKEFEKVHDNPNKEKIENGKQLEKNMEIVKELVTRGFSSIEPKYSWECESYNNYYGYKEYNYKMQLFKEKMWKNPMYRGFIKFLQKIGIISIIKKIKK